MIQTPVNRDNSYRACIRYKRLSQGHREKNLLNTVAGSPVVYKATQCSSPHPGYLPSHEPVDICHHVTRISFLIPWVNILNSVPG